MRSAYKNENKRCSILVAAHWRIRFDSSHRFSNTYGELSEHNKSSQQQQQQKKNEKR